MLAFLQEPVLWRGLGHLNIFLHEDKTAISSTQPKGWVKSSSLYGCCSNPVFCPINRIVHVGSTVRITTWPSALGYMTKYVLHSPSNFLHKKNKKNPLRFLIVVGKTTIPSALEAGFSYVETPCWQNDCWSPPSPAYHAQQLGLMCQNPSVSALCVQSWKEKASYRTWLSSSSKTQLGLSGDQESWYSPSQDASGMEALSKLKRSGATCFQEGRMKTGQLKLFSQESIKLYISGLLFTCWPILRL